MAEKNTTADLYIAMPDGTFDHLIHDPKIKIEVVEKMPDGAWYAMGMFRSLEKRESAHRLAQRHTELTGHETRVVAVLSVEEYAGELERRGRIAAKSVGVEAPAKAPKKSALWAQTPDGTWVKRTSANPYTAALAVKYRDKDEWFIPTFSRTAANAATAGAGYARHGHDVRVVPVISDAAMRAALAAELPAEPTPAEAEDSARRDAAAKTVALRATKNATVAVVPGPTPPAEAEDGRRIELRQTSAITGAGAVLDAGGRRLVTIVAVRGRMWTVGTASAAASGSTLAIAVKRWARGHGIAKGSAIITNERTGRVTTTAWDGWRNR